METSDKKTIAWIMILTPLMLLIRELFSKLFPRVLGINIPLTIIAVSSVIIGTIIIKKE